MSEIRISPFIVDYQEPLNGITRLEEWNSEWQKVQNDSIIQYVPQFFLNLPVHADTIILDVGCGSGNTVKILSEYGYNAYGLDGSHRYKKRWDELGINDRCKIADIKNLASITNNNSVDIVTSAQILDAAYDKNGSYYAHVNLFSIEEFHNQLCHLLTPGGIYACFEGDDNLERLWSNLEETQTFQWLVNEPQFKDTYDARYYFVKK